LDALAPARRRLLLGVLAAVAVVLSAVGIYGLLAYTVSQRSEEIGVRLALGADPARVGRMILADGMRMAVIGIVPGVLGAYAAARGMSALLFGVAPDAIRRAAASFRGVEHRLEEVALVDRVRFVNDSQGTQPDAVVAALRAFPAPVVLIAGGRDKGVDLGDLPAAVAERAYAAVLIGESGPALGARFQAAGLPRCERAASLEAAAGLSSTVAAARPQRRDR